MLNGFIITPYVIVFFFIFIGVIIGLVIYFISYFFIAKNYNNEKVSVYECGFDPFSKSTTVFDIRYYLVSILFIIFDLEISFLFPWSLVFKQLGFYGFFSVFGFLLILSLGFIYEWLQGALDWSSISILLVSLL